MIAKVFSGLFLSALVSAASAAGPFDKRMPMAVPATLDSASVMLDRIEALRAQENERAMAIMLAVALGPFGGHRLYLGTGPKVPIIYTLTLGGGLGILPAIDLIHLALRKDLEPYRNNRQVFMWVPPKEEPTPQ